MRRARLPHVLRLAGLAAACCCAFAATAAQAKAPAKPAKLVLKLADLGHGYRVNSGLTGVRTLADVSESDTAAVKRELSHSWLKGVVHGFNGVSVPWGVVSIADVFRPSAHMDVILTAWERDLVRISKGRRQRTPAKAPGTGGVLVRGHLLTYELLIYMWRRGNTISSVDLTGPKGKVPLSLLMRLVHRQDAKVLASSAVK